MEERVSIKKRRITGLFKQYSEYQDRHELFGTTLREEEEPKADQPELKSPKIKLKFGTKNSGMQLKKRNEGFDKEGPCHGKMESQRILRNDSRSESSPLKVAKTSKARVPFSKIPTLPHHLTTMPCETPRTLKRAETFILSGGGKLNSVEENTRTLRNRKTYCLTPPDVRLKRKLELKENVHHLTTMPCETPRSRESLETSILSGGGKFNSVEENTRTLRNRKTYCLTPPDVRVKRTLALKENVPPI